jgi:hypothetical protein
LFIFFFKDAEAQSECDVVFVVESWLLDGSKIRSKLAPIEPVSFFVFIKMPFDCALGDKNKKDKGESGMTVHGKTIVVLLKTEGKFTFIVRKSKLWSL